MNITFWVTEDCNLRCKYCYVNKNKQYFKPQYIDKIINFIRDQVTTTNDRSLNINFHGGEPTLNFPLIKEIVEHLNALKRILKLEIQYFITTNGTIINNAILDFFDTNNFNVSVSIDGIKSINDKNRIYPNGKGSFNKVLKTLNKFKAQHIYTRIRMTLTPETVCYLFDSYKYFYELGFIGITTVPETTFSEWSYTDIKLYESEMVKILRYLKEKSSLDFKNFVHNIGMCTLKKLNICDGGINTFHFASSGNIYPCALVVGNPKFIIGNINQGLNRSKISNLSKEYSIDNERCQKCILKKHCEGNRCKFINFATTGNYHQSSNSYCALHKIQLKLFKKGHTLYEQKI